MKRFIIVLFSVGLFFLLGVYFFLSRLHLHILPQNNASVTTVMASTLAVPTVVDQTVLPQIQLPDSPVLAAGVLAGIVLMGIGWFGYQTSRQRGRDAQRRKDLADIQAGFEAYRKKYSHYPVSQTFESHYYSLVNLSNDWQYYGMPEAVVMRKYLPNWPILDPQHQPDNHDQTNQYLYYPHDNGTSYDLFAHLELPKTAEAEDCNEREGIPRVMGIYNVRVSSPAAVAADDHPAKGHFG